MVNGPGRPEANREEREAGEGGKGESEPEIVAEEESEDLDVAVDQSVGPTAAFDTAFAIEDGTR